MAGIFDLIGQMGSPQEEAATSTPINYREFFGPILESVAAEAKRASNPMSRIGDVGGAIFESLATGTPYSRNLAALGEQRTKAISGAGNMFLNVLGQERQLEELKGQERRHQESIAVQRERLGQQSKEFGITSGQTERRLTTEERRETRREEEQKRRDFQTSLRLGIGDAGKDLTPEGKGELERRLRSDPEYQTAFNNDSRTALDRFNQHYAAVSSDPRFVKPDPNMPAISKLQRALTQAKTPEERAAIQLQIDEETAKAQKAKVEAQKAQGEMALLDRASKTLEQSFNKLIDPKGGADRKLLFSIWTNMPGTEGRQIRNQITQTLLDYVFARSGKQVSVQEIDRWLGAYMPSYLDDDATVKQKVKSLRQNLEVLSQQQGIKSIDAAKTWATGPSGKRIYTTDQGKTWFNEDGTSYR